MHSHLFGCAFLFFEIKNSGVHTDYSIGINSLFSIFFGAFLGTVTINLPLSKEVLISSVRTSFPT